MTIDSFSETDKEEKEEKITQHDKNVHETTCLTLSVPTPQNGQTHSNKSLAIADKFFICV